MLFTWEQSTSDVWTTREIAQATAQSSLMQDTRTQGSQLMKKDAAVQKKDLKENVKGMLSGQSEQHKPPSHCCHVIQEASVIAA